MQLQQHHHCRFCTINTSRPAENNKIFGQAGFFGPHSSANIQFMAEDSTKYAATGGWGFGFFIDGKPVDEAKMKSCFPSARKKLAEPVFHPFFAP